MTSTDVSSVEASRSDFWLEWQSMLSMRANPAAGPARGAVSRVIPLWCLLILAESALPQAPDGTPSEPADGPEATGIEPLEPWPGGEAADEPGLPVTRFEARLAFDRLLADEDYNAAVAVGERMVELTIDEFGAEAVETGDAYAALGRAQREAGDYEAAEESYLRSVEVMRATGGTYSEHLIDPLIGLGDTYHVSEQHLEAVSAYNEARSVNRRVYGLLNEDQIEILDRMTESFYAMEEFQEAGEQQLEALRLIERVYEPHSRETLEAVYKYADWLQRNNRFTEEREHYTRAIRTIREHYGEDDVLLVEPLRRMANSFRQQRAAHGQGISALNDALEILTEQSAPDRLQLARVLRDIGDWETAFSSVGPDNTEYRQAWELLGGVENGDELRSDWFSGVNYVLREPHSTRGLSTAPDAVQGTTTVRLDIDEQGRSRNVAIVESDPPGFKDEAFLRQVRNSRFRPHMEDGVVVPAERLGLRFTFRYLPDELEDGG